MESDNKNMNIEHRTPNIERPMEEMKKQTNDILEEAEVLIKIFAMRTKTDGEIPRIGVVEL